MTATDKPAHPAPTDSPTGDNPTLKRRVADHLAAVAGRGLTSFATLPGGHSGLTYRVGTDQGELVVKAVPEGQKPIGRHDMMRQAAILGALADTDVPVPQIIAVDETEPAWFAMTLIGGQALEPVLDDPETPPATAAARMLRAAAILPRLHAVDHTALPSAGDILSPADELDRWARTLNAVPPELVEGGQHLLELLRASVPAPLEPTLVHGDYRLGNIICAGDEPAALIDWEIWSIGDPRVELGWFLVFADGSNFPGVGRDVPGLPTADELIATYLQNSSLDELPDMTWFNALGRLKMAAIMGHNLRRHREGRHHDPVQEELPATINQLIRTGTALFAD